MSLYSHQTKPDLHRNQPTISYYDPPVAEPRPAASLLPVFTPDETDRAGMYFIILAVCLLLVAVSL